MILFPCEVFHREFDAKLLLASHLCSKQKNSVLIGYDKHFNNLLPHLADCVLLDKSCSSLMWNSRIKPCLSHDGRVVISDEEGFNNINKTNSAMWSTRLDFDAAKSIDLYACWGNIDYEYFSRFSELSSKLNILGNCRSDLLSSCGKDLYSELSSSFGRVFSKYVMCVDNFCVEHRLGSYKPPAFNKSIDENRRVEEEFNKRQEEQKIRRDFYASLLKKVAAKLPSLTFIVRPHPCADERWWCDQFWSYRNVHILYHHNIEPWLHSATAVISMGCTTSLQAIVASTPVIEVKNDMNLTTLDSANKGYAHNYTKLFCQNEVELLDCLSSAAQTPHNTFRSLDLLNQNWHNCFESNTSSVFSEYIYELSRQCNASSFSNNIKHLEGYRNFRQKSRLAVNSIKWISPSLPHIERLLSDISKAFSLDRPQLTKVCDDLYLLRPS
tara:strand:+ start:437 stop:1756 length:1320 start_codon:yes stop_codon:yes gene_type:complete